MPNITTNYLYTGTGPFDSKSLKSTYSELLDVATWTADDSSFFAYNGMIVAVWKDSDSANNGIYYLFDTSYTGQRGKKPDITNPANWRKISDTIDVSVIENTLSDHESRLKALEEKESDVVTYGYRSGFPTTGEANKLYVAADEGKSYIWFDNDYLPVSGGASSDSEYDIIYGGSAEA